MDEWRMPQQPHRMIAGGVGPVLGYHSMRSRSAPYPTAHPMVDMKQAYQYPPNPASTPSNPLSPPAPTTTAPSPMPGTTPILSKTDSNDPTSTTSDDVSVLAPTPDVYTSNNPTVSYSPAQMDQIQQQQQQRSMSTKSSIGPMMSYNAGQQQMMVARSRSMPYPMPPPPSHHHAHPHHSPMYPAPPGQGCQCPQHMHSHSSHYPMHPAQHPMYYQHQQQQQQHEAWYRYQQHQAAWRQHHMQQQQQQQQQRLQSHPQPVPIQQSYEAILADNTSTTKLKASKSKAKKKPSNISSLDDEASMKYQPMPLPTMNPALSLQQQQQQQQQQRVGIPPSHAAYYQALYSAPNTYVPAQQLPPPPSASSSLPPSQEHALYAQTSPQTLSHPQSQIFTSPLSNPSTPHQLHGNGEFTGTNEFGVPYHHGAPGSVNSLTDALCPNGEVTDRQMTPGPPSVGTPRVAAHQYSFPHTPLTPQTINSQSMNPHTPVMMPPTPNPLSAPPTPLTRPRSSSEQAQSAGNHFQQYEQNKSVSNVDELAAYLKDPADVYLADDVSPSFFDEIDALANTYLGQQANAAPQANVDQNSAEDILLNFLCADELTS